MSIGNDVVDLADAETLPEQLHPRFDERVFSPGELAALRAGDLPHALRWTLWAAKESAYKAQQRLEPDLVFSPREFVVDLALPLAAQTGVGQGSVQHRGSFVDLAVTWNEEYVHAVAASDRTGGARQLSKVALADQEPSAAVRDLAATALGSAFGLDPAGIEIVGRPPVAVLGGHRLAVSLAHHGRFVAFAVLLPHAPSSTTPPCAEQSIPYGSNAVLRNTEGTSGAKAPTEAALPWWLLR